MKLFNDLTPAEQDLALHPEVENLVASLVDRSAVLPDAKAQAKVEQSIQLAARRRTPELAPFYIHSSLKMYLDNHVAGLVKTNLYAEPHEVVVHNVVGCTVK